MQVGVIMKEYDRIVMDTDSYINDGIKKGDTGYILEIYDSNYCEIEFSDNNGITYALQSIACKDFHVLNEQQSVPWGDVGDVPQNGSADPHNELK